ncbi:pyridoxamine 5'-phosphate oxidase family protein [Amycolatopsis sp. NPDC024027]|uniref:pyridoxamine 5'-phosphate oxidase family protein n=1 Tax=Amycolatopsis sp. NPDC024027 TaxID=3154327 RepID=UPI0033E18442
MHCIGPAARKIAWLTTVTPKGRPAPRPLWFVLNSDSRGGSILVVTGKAHVEAGKPSEAPGYLDKYGSHFAGIGLTADGFDAKYSVRIRVVPERSWGF